MLRFCQPDVVDVENLFYVKFLPVTSNMLQFFLVKYKWYKAIAMMRGKSPSSEYVWEKNQVEQLFGFKRGFGKGDNFIVIKM